MNIAPLFALLTACAEPEPIQTPVEDSSALCMAEIKADDIVDELIANGLSEEEINVQAIAFSWEDIEAEMSYQNNPALRPRRVVYDWLLEEMETREGIVHNYLFSDEVGLALTGTTSAVPFIAMDTEYSTGCDYDQVLAEQIQSLDPNFLSEDLSFSFDKELPNGTHALCVNTANAIDAIIEAPVANISPIDLAVRLAGHQLGDSDHGTYPSSDIDKERGIACAFSLN